MPILMAVFMEKKLKPSFTTWNEAQARLAINRTWRLISRPRNPNITMNMTLLKYRRE